MKVPCPSSPRPDSELHPGRLCQIPRHRVPDRSPAFMLNQLLTIGRQAIYIQYNSRRVVPNSSCTIDRMSRIGSLSSVLRISRASGSTFSRRFASSSTTSPTLRNRWVTLASIGVCLLLSYVNPRFREKLISGGWNYRISLPTTCFTSR